MGKRKAGEVIDLDEDYDATSLDETDSAEDVSDDEMEMAEPTKKRARTNSTTTKKSTSTTKKTTSTSKKASSTTNKAKPIPPVDFASVATKAMKELGENILEKIKFKGKGGRFTVERIEREVFEAMFPKFDFKPTKNTATISCKSNQEVCDTIGEAYCGRSFRYRGSGSLTKLSIRFDAVERRISVSFKYDVEK